MADREVLREFLMSLGFEVNAGEYKKFMDTVAMITKRLALVGGAVLSVGTGAEELVRKFSSSMEKLYYASKRTGASVKNIMALQFGSEQIGISADKAASSLESMAQALRVNPGTKGLLDQLIGHNSSGEDKVKVMIELLSRLRKMPHYIGAQFASIFGMDEETFLMYEQKLPDLIASMRKWNSLLESSGIDTKKASEQSREYQNRLRIFTAQVELLYHEVANALLPAFVSFAGWVNKGADKFVAWGSAIKNWSMARITSELSDYGKQLQETLQYLEEFEDKYQIISKTGDILYRSLVLVVSELGAIGHEFLDIVNVLLAIANGDYKGAWKNLLAMSKHGQDMIDAVKQSMAESPTSATQDTEKAPSGRKIGLGVSLNNPGNLRSWGGVPTERGFAHFSSLNAGLKAMARQLHLYGIRGKDTISSIISTYAPSSENNTQAYIADVARRMGVNPNTHLAMNNPQVMASLMRAMIMHEQGYMPVTSGAVLSAARSQGSGEVVVHQTNNISVNGSHAQDVASEVAKAIHNANANIIRNHAGAIS